MTPDLTPPHTGLRVLAADEDQRLLDEMADVLRGLGHHVTAIAVGIREAADQIMVDEPDLSLVIVHDNIQLGLDIVGEINEYSSGPVIAVLEGVDPSVVREAAERGIYAYAEALAPDPIQSAIELAIERHRDTRALRNKVDQLEGALGRRALIERAKGILMERHSVDERAAFEQLRAHARSRNQTVVEIARAVNDGHGLLPAVDGDSPAG